MATTKYSQTIKGNKDAAEAFKRQADLLADQIRARDLGRRNLTTQYSNAKYRNFATRRHVVSDLLKGFRTAQEGYDRAEKDATGNLGTVANSSRLNRAREGASAMAEIANMGGSITDRIKAMAPSIRNLKANLDGGVNDYANAITGINNSLGDLNTSTQTNINNALREQNVSNAQAFAEWSAGNQQAYADMVDLFGQRGSAFEQMAETLVTKKSSTKSSGTTSIKSTQKDSYDHNAASRDAVERAESSFDSSATMARRLADQMGRTFTDKIMTIDEMNAAETNPNMKFTAAQLKANQSNLDELANAGTLKKLLDAEGSKLRKTVRA